MYNENMVQYKSMANDKKMYWAGKYTNIQDISSANDSKAVLDRNVYKYIAYITSQ